MYLAINRWKIQSFSRNYSFLMGLFFYAAPCTHAHRPCSDNGVVYRHLPRCHALSKALLCWGYSFVTFIKTLKDFFRARPYNSATSHFYPVILLNFFSWNLVIVLVSCPSLPINGMQSTIVFTPHYQILS